MTAKANVNYREYITADGRDLSQEEWRRIPEFPIYEITKDGDLRNRRTGYILQEIENKRTGAFYYSVHHKDGKKRNRGYKNLVALAWGSDRPESDWRTIPNFPKYQITQDGEVRNARTRSKLKVQQIHRMQEKTVRFREDGLYYRVQVQKLIERTWPTEEEDAA